MENAGEKYIHEIKELLDASFGAGYMEESAIWEHMHSDRSLLYLMQQKGELAGVMLFVEEDPRERKGEMEKAFAEIQSITGSKRCLHCKFLCTPPKYRRQGFGGSIAAGALADIQSRQRADVVYTCLWEYENNVPAKRIFEENDFQLYKRLENPWYEDKDYYCIVCRGRCCCPGQVYYKRL